jgi:LDH2 family malate/lactate/ureidoglycolate dehydrogenase
MDAMIDALHAAPPADANAQVSYPGEIESATAAEREKNGIALHDRLFGELQALAARFGLQLHQE